jgi:hypothetical protein
MTERRKKEKKGRREGRTEDEGRKERTCRNVKEGARTNSSCKRPISSSFDNSDIVVMLSAP